MSRSSIPRYVLLLLSMSVAMATCAQSPPATQDPRQMSEAERKVYAQTLHEAKDLLDRKQYADAITKLDKLSAERPREPQAQFLKGIALTDEGRNDEAIAAFRTLLAEFPELPEPRNNLAVLYAQKGEYALARDELERAVQAAPDYAVAHENLGDVYTRLAEVEYEKTMSLDKRNRSAPAKLKLVREIPSNAK
ncbi:MAG TPA: tetratricopeptide repeat protein [Casimicrobiaceae bacterium]|nr:tetratricopeptide repeat protein [Casimicrobiaceae bacterium]